MLQEEFKKAEELAMHFKAYIQTEIELLKLRIAEKISKILANFLAAIVVIVIISIFILFVSLALALLIGEWLGKMSTGFFYRFCNIPFGWNNYLVWQRKIN